MKEFYKKAYHILGTATDLVLNTYSVATDKLELLPDNERVYLNFELSEILVFETLGLGGSEIGTLVLVVFADLFASTTELFTLKRPTLS